MANTEAKTTQRPVIADYHTHMTDAFDIDVNKGSMKGLPFRGFYWDSTKRFPSDTHVLRRVLGKSFAVGSDYAMKYGQKVDTLAGIINFDDNRAQMAFKELRKIALEFGYDLQEKGSLISIYAPKRDQRAVFISGQEAATNEGHVLLAGIERNIESKDLGDVLLMARDAEALIFGDHAMKNGALTNAGNSAINRASRLSLNRKSLEQYAHYFDAICIGGKDQEQTARDLNIPLYASSDSHDVDYMFNGYTLFPVVEGLDVLDENKVKKSIRTAFAARNYGINRGSSTPFENLRHRFSVAGIHFGGLKTGLLKRRL
jgi:hypothetical protein